jgi:hypothetical protein
LQQIKNDSFNFLLVHFGIFRCGVIQNKNDNDNVNTF